MKGKEVLLCQWKTLSPSFFLSFYLSIYLYLFLFFLYFFLSFFLFVHFTLAICSREILKKYGMHPTLQSDIANPQYQHMDFTKLYDRFWRSLTCVSNGGSSEMKGLGV